MSKGAWKHLYRDRTTDYGLDAKGQKRDFYRYFSDRVREVPSGDPKLSGACWTWTGKNDETGQPITHWRRRMVPAWKVAYYLEKGEMPRSGMVQEVLCQTPHCLNPYHFKVVPVIDTREFYSHTEKQGEHLIWVGPKIVSSDRAEEYPTHKISGQPRSARKIAYNLTHKVACPDAYVVYVTCGEDMCVEGSHLVARPRNWAAVKSVKERRVLEPRTHCRNGHEITEESHYYDPRGRFVCRYCGHDRMKRLREKMEREHVALGDEDTLPIEVDFKIDNVISGEVPDPNGVPPIDLLDDMSDEDLEELELKARSKDDWISSLLDL